MASPKFTVDDILGSLDDTPPRTPTPPPLAATLHQHDSTIDRLLRDVPHGQSQAPPTAALTHDASTDRLLRDLLPPQPPPAAVVVATPHIAADLSDLLLSPPRGGDESMLRHLTSHQSAPPPAQQHNPPAAVAAPAFDQAVLLHRVADAEHAEAAAVQAAKDAEAKLKKAQEECAALQREAMDLKHRLQQAQMVAAVSAVKSRPPTPPPVAALDASVSRQLRLDSASPVHRHIDAERAGQSTLRRSTFRERQRLVQAGQSPFAIFSPPSHKLADAKDGTPAVNVTVQQQQRSLTDRWAMIEAAHRQAIVQAAADERIALLSSVVMSFYTAAATLHQHELLLSQALASSPAAHNLSLGSSGGLQNHSMIPLIQVQSQATIAGFQSFAGEAVHEKIAHLDELVEDRLNHLAETLETKLHMLHQSIDAARGAVHLGSRPPIPLAGQSRHRRTASQESGTSSLAGSFAAEGATSAGDFATSGAPLTPRSGPKPNLRASLVRRASISMSASEAALMMASPTNAGPTNASAPPLRGADRPEAHRKLLLCGRIASSPTHSGVSPPLRVDELVAEATKWTAADFSDYARFTSHHIFLLGAKASGKSSVAYCLTNKPPVFLKKVPKVDTPSMAARFTAYTLRGVKVPEQGIPLGGFDDQRVDVKSLMKAAASPLQPGGNKGGAYAVQTSAAVRLVDVPMHVLSLGGAPGGLPARGAVYCLCFPMHGDPTAFRADLAKVVKHVVATAAGSAFPMPSVAIDDSARDIDEARRTLRPMQISFVLLGTHSDRLPKNKSDETAIQSALRDEREWLLRLFDQIGCSPAPINARTATDVDGGAGRASAIFTSSAAAPVQANLIDCFAVSCANWTVTGERARTATTFPELIEQLYTWSALHSPTAPEHLAATTIRHFAASLLNDEASSADGGDVSLNEVAASTLRLEVTRCALTPLRVNPNPSTASQTWVASNGTAPTTVEQGFALLQQCFMSKRAVVAQEQKRQAAADGASSPAPVPQGSPALGVSLGASPSQAAFGVESNLLLGANNQASFSSFPPPSLTRISFAEEELPEVYKDAAKYLIASFAFGFTTLFTALQRWVDYAGCVIDGVIFQGLVVQHLHIKSVAGKLVSVAIAATKAEGVDLMIDDATVRHLQDQLATALSKRLVASVLAVGRARGLFNMVDTVANVGCSVVLLGLTFPLHIQSLVALPVQALRSCECGTLASITADKQDAVQQHFAVALRDGLHFSDELSRALVKAGVDMAEMAELEARLGAGAFNSRPPPPASLSLNVGVELLMQGYITANMVEALVKTPLETLVVPSVAALAFGPRIAALARPLPDTFVNNHRIQLPTAGTAICTADRDTVALALAPELSKGAAAYIAFAMTMCAESTDSTLIGNVSVQCAPLGFVARFGAGLLSTYGGYITAFRAWSNALVFSVSSLPIDWNNQPPTSTKAKSGSSGGNGPVLPEGAIVNHVFVHFTDEGNRLKARACVVCLDSTPASGVNATLGSARGGSTTSAALFSKYVLGATATSTASLGSTLASPVEALPPAASLSVGGSSPANLGPEADGALFDDVESCFETVVKPVFEAEAFSFGRSPSALCVAPPIQGDDSGDEGGASNDAATVCHVTSNCSVGGPQVLPWESVAPRAREMLVGVPRAAVDTSVNALRRLMERSVTDFSLRSVIEPLATAFA